MSAVTRAGRFFFVWLALAAGIALPAMAHEVRPAFMQVTELPRHRYDILWKQPNFGMVAARLVPHISGGLLEGPPSATLSQTNFEIRIWRNVYAGEQGLDGRTLHVEGLDQTITDVLVSISLASGDSQQRVLRPQDSAMTFNLQKGAAATAYIGLGVEHILTGIDHLLFILGLMLLVRRPVAVIKTITAFTVAHSITLGAAALHVIAIRPAVIEALVALSIVFIAVELVHYRRGEDSLTVRFPWVIAFTFGLLHGAAFAGALAQIGLPPNAIPLSLFLFNVGVELGQLMFVGLVVIVIWALPRLPRKLPAWTRWVPPYAIGSTSAFWFLERLQAALG